ncbi:MAG TPA: hypothetical protein VK474_11655, partial [Chthoniobacterales bacterium]|nr:hypothetical protein [Chthoniobacterales bacterium]
MIHQRHRIALLHAGIAATGDKGHAKAVAGGARGGAQHLVVARFHRARDHRHGPLLFPQGLEDLRQVRIQWHRVALLF